MKLVLLSDSYKSISQEEFSLVTRPNFQMINFIPLNLLIAYSTSITETLLSHDTYAFLMWSHLLKKSCCTIEMSRNVLCSLNSSSNFLFSMLCWNLHSRDVFVG